MDLELLFSELEEAGFNKWVKQLESQQGNWFIHHGDYRRWSAAISRMPDIDNPLGCFNLPAVTIDGECEYQDLLIQALKGLMPWRKGPYRFAHILVDSEWRSDFKWERVLPHLASLQNRKILDIGCGNGYHCWRMLDQDPKTVIGIEPSVLFNLQFQAVNKYLNRTDIHLLPLAVEDLPDEMCWFDTVFSMGVLYHRRSPIDHLFQLQGLLAPGGQLCLETLVIEGGSGDVLVPAERYARMKNVWFLPSASELLKWMQRCGFVDTRMVDISITTSEEQRTTDWMQFESLSESLDQKNTAKTVEGLPAPRRAFFLATKP